MKLTRNNRLRILALAVVVVGIVADQLTKLLAVRYLAPIPTYPLWKNVFHLTYVENRGAAFGMLADHRWIFMVISTVAIAALAVWLLRAAELRPLSTLGLSLIISGGIGNMIDRIRLGYVVDFLDFTLIDFAVFNVADSYVCVGAGVLALAMLLDILRESREKKGKGADPDEADT